MKPPQSRRDPQPLYWAFTVDADPDHFDASLGDPASAETLSWRGLREGIPQLRSIVASIAGAKIVTTWFVRMDDQIEAVEGSSAFVLDTFQELWRVVVADGDEIGLHAHLLRCDEGRWSPETDAQRAAVQLERSYRAMRFCGFRPVSSRIGGAFHSNQTMAALNAWGVTVDSTALPGRVRHDATRHFDWEGTPARPYHPSRHDYRRPGTDPVNLLEVPMSMLETRTAYDAAPVMRYADLTFHPALLRPGLRPLLEHMPILVTIVHPTCVLRDFVSTSHGLIAFDPEALRENITWIFSEAERLGRPVRPITMGDCARVFSEAMSRGVST